MKRALDLVVSVPAVVLAAPLMGLIGALIWLEDRGSPLFRQQRIGADLTPFVILKFRTMPTATPQVQSSEAQDLTVTRIGKVLRRLSLDELPQLLNVVRGDMSLVGPRPPIPSQTDLLELRTESGAHRLRPGLTGLAQVRGVDGMSAADKAANDAEYAASVTLRSDLAIAFRTVGYLLHKPPAY